jgi:hypothetical protein
LHRGIPNESARVTTINDNPLFNTRDERLRIQAVLRHLGSGADLRDFAASPSEKVALVKTANQRGLIAWHKARGRYELTTTGWCELAPSRRFGVGSVMLGTTVGATLGAAALAVFWFIAGAAHRPLPPRTVVAAASAQSAKQPAPTAAPTAPASTSAAPTPTQAPPPAAAAPAPALAAAPVELDPPIVAQGPTPEERAEAAARAKQAAAARKVRQRAAAKRKREEAARAWAARRKREEAARAWAATHPRTRQADYSGNGGYGGNGGQNPWYAYR